MKLLTYSENDFSNPLQRPYGTILTLKLPPVILKIVPEAGFGVYTGENRPVAVKQRRKPTNGRVRKAGSEVLIFFRNDVYSYN
jgi:hypothetical protein